MEERPFLMKLARYGVPLIIVVFYLKATGGFAYTADGTFLVLQSVRNLISGQGLHAYSILPASGTPSPFWSLLIGAGNAFNLSPVLLAKILSMFFCSLTVLLVYLVAMEVTDDLVLALCCTLIAAINAWLLELAPSGLPQGLLAALLLSSLFALLRGDRVLAAILLVLASLLSWQCLGLFVPLVLDAVLTRETRPSLLRLVTVLYLLLTLAFAVWGYLTLWRGYPWVPVLPGSTLAVGDNGFSLGFLALVAGGSVLGVTLLATRRFQDSWLGVRHLLVLAWGAWLVTCGMVWERGFLIPAMLMGLGYALLGIHLLCRRLGRSSLAAVFVFTALAMVLEQFDGSRFATERMRSMRESEAVVTKLAFWARTAVPEGASVQAEWPGLVSFVTERPVTTLPPGEVPVAEYVISSREEMFGYVLLSTAANDQEAAPDTPARRFQVWRRR